MKRLEVTSSELKPDGYIYQTGVMATGREITRRVKIKDNQVITEPWCFAGTERIAIK